MTEKTIDTLVEDIYALFTSEDVIDISQESIDSFAKSVAKTVAERVSEVREVRERNLRMSLIGHPDRKIYYELNGTPKESNIDGPTQIKFLYGDILEHLLLFLVRAAGHTVTEEQKELTVEGVKGHKDCSIDGRLVDIKSASDYSFRKFATGKILEDDPFGYVAQLSGYSDAEGGGDAGWLVVNKVSGELIFTDLHEIDMIRSVDRIKHVRELISKPEPPEKCYPAEPDGASGNMKLSIGCQYCEFKNTCWADANDGKGIRRFQYSNKVVELVDVKKEPRVEEI